jgi:tetratricopeptide (TPR) repeat protein
MPRVARPPATPGPRPQLPRDAGGGSPRIGPAAWVALALAVGTLALFAPAYSAGFVNYDDPDYVTANPHVQGGLTGPNVAWSFKTTHAANWHPLTWLSLQLDATVYGSESAAGFHLTNVVLHVSATVLLFVALRRMTGALGPPALVAALFAAHPMHVESVAWVAERKDVLSGLFWMLVLYAYARYAERPTPGRYLAVLGAFAVGLTAKPMLVTLPCVLLLLDYWPLDRSGARRLVWEKMPLFALSVAAAAVTVYAQQTGGAVRTFAAVPVDERLANALTAYVRYLVLAVVPAGQSVFYPHPAHTPLWQSAGALLVLAAITAAAVWHRRRAPYVLVGWLWFLGTLVPVIGLVQVGAQAMADRYTYLPYVGLFVAAVWGGSALTAGRPRLGLAVGAAAVGACVVATWSRLPVWHDSLALWEDARWATSESAIAENNLGTALEAAGRADEADEHYATAVRLDPRHLEARYNLGNALVRRADAAGAVEEYEAALDINPRHPMVLINYGLLRQRMAQPDQAAALFRRAGDALTATGDAEAAAECYRLADGQARVVENPWYRHWTGFEPGAGAVRAITTAGPDGVPTRTTETTRLVEKGAFEIVLEVETTGPGPPVRSREQIPRAGGLAPGVRREELGTHPAGAVEEGSEVIAVGGAEYRATRFRVRAGGAAGAQTTIWMADAVPGQVVRSETRTADGRVVRSVEVVRVLGSRS